MAHLKSNCSLRNPTLRENLNIEFDIRLEGKVMEDFGQYPLLGVKLWLRYIGMAMTGKREMSFDTFLNTL